MNKDNPNISIVTVGYNKPDAMMRLLNSLLVADYLGDRVDLIVRIEKGPRQAEIVKRANEFIWPFGEKRVRTFPSLGSNAGLRESKRVLIDNCSLQN